MTNSSNWPSYTSSSRCIAAPQMSDNCRFCFFQPRWRWFQWTLSPAPLTQIFNGRIHYHWPDHRIFPNREHLRGRIQSGLCQTSEFTAASSQSLWATVTLKQWPCKRNTSSRTVEFQSWTALLTFDTMGVFKSSTEIAQNNRIELIIGLCDLLFMRELKVAH